MSRPRWQLVPIDITLCSDLDTTDVLGFAVSDVVGNVLDDVIWGALRQVVDDAVYGVMGGDL